MEDKLYDIFAGYDPELSSDSLFMSRLSRNIKAVELVKSNIEERRRKSRLAILMAALIGFITGIISVIAYPFLMDSLTQLAEGGDVTADFITDYGSVLIWCVAAILAGVFSYASYDLTLLFSKRDLR